ncbi:MULTISPECIES: TRAP transporter small permease [unclassified Oceanobacter]|uniref:TRAP transporter small permease n=2 Tax=Oceanobacter TaxID=196079 RepID=UPI0026E413EA|nr:MULTISPECIES: TRAP transporter small permease subunit [unclassified Oceanobacter]MDO6683708.1 TRAP transporter small permease subunit [Oceanobacter sp. 5_MG-2023]MDP2608325.1 TRAP transporter small permease subunit [Oceanobacter sp. 1_MG-2023]MDP2612210.1 TRAP transporter small permease subunit [Oceanobacter sp. 2_MG-2023]
MNPLAASGASAIGGVETATDTSASYPDPTGVLIMLSKWSDRLARLELAAAGAMLTLVLGLLLLNIVTRAIGQALFWIDEAAVLGMVWMVFLASAASLHNGTNIAMTLVIERLPERLAQLMAVVVNATLLVFVGVLLWMLWRWFDPLTLWSMGGDTSAYAASTFNFIYDEPTMTLGFHKVWFWLVLPVFALGSVFHLVVRLLNSVKDLTALTVSTTQGEQ